MGISENMPDCGNRSTITRLTKYPHFPKENASAQKELAKTKEIKETTNSPARPDGDDGGGELRRRVTIDSDDTRVYQLNTPMSNRNCFYTKQIITSRVLRRSAR